MKTTILFSLFAAAMFGSASVLAGPVTWTSLGPKAPPRFLAPHPELKCETMTVAAGGKYGGSQVVPCKQYAGIRPAECRIACSRK